MATEGRRIRLWHGSEPGEKERQRLTDMIGRAESRSRELYEKAHAAAKDSDLDAQIRHSAGNARNMATLALQGFAAGWPVEGWSALELAQRYWSEARRLLLLPYAVAGKKEIERNRKKGGVSKRRGWADLLAEHEQINAWNDIPDDLDEPLVIDTLEADLRLYRDGDRVICFNDYTRKESSLKRSTFEKRYLNPSLKKRGQ